MRLAALCLVIIAVSSPVHAHDEDQRRADASSQWIQDQKLRNKSGDLCCGNRDCNAVDPAIIRETDRGYMLDHGTWTEVIPYSEVAPFSPDARLWVCRYNVGGARRCVFGPPAKTM